MTHWKFEDVMSLLELKHFLSLLYPTAAPAAASAAGGDAPSSRRWRWGSVFGRPHSWPGEEEADPAAAGTAAPCTQVPATRAGQWRGEGLRPPSLPHYEERTQPYDPLPGRQVLPGWVAALESKFKLSWNHWLCLYSCFVNGNIFSHSIDCTSTFTWSSS